METLKRRSRFHRRHVSTMSITTKKFLQKICYKQTASVDMTRHGFMRDSKVYPMQLFIKPLWQQLEKICGKAETPANKRLLSKRESGVSHAKDSPRRSIKFKMENTKIRLSTKKKTTAV